MNKIKMPGAFNSKMAALFSCLVSVCIFFSAKNYNEEAEGYLPMPQQVLLDVYNRPIGEQDLLVEATHNIGYNNNEEGGASGDFATEAMLSFFSYNKDDLNSGEVLRIYREFFSEEKADKVYQDIFMNLSQQRIVQKQDGIVRARMIGDIKYVGQAVRDYETTAGLDLKSATFKFTGKILITVHAKDEFPTLYQFEVLVQRALIQDKIRAYQLIQLDLI
jgi:hypothetical protein